MYYVYILREKASNNVIYVGYTKYPTRRFKEHKESLDDNHDRKCQDVHQYMKDNNLMLYKDVEISLIDCLEFEEEAIAREIYYTNYYSSTVKNHLLGNIKDGKYNQHARKIMCLNDGKVFDTVRECSKYYKLREDRISGQLNKTYHNNLFSKVINDYIFFVDVEDNINIETRKIQLGFYKVFCVENNKYFRTLKECGGYYNITPAYLNAKLKKNGIANIKNLTFKKPS